MQDLHPAQNNIINGAPLVYEIADEGAYVTIIDRNQEPLILALDAEDLNVFARIHEQHQERVNRPVLRRSARLEEELALISDM